jgi:hypothetical protein
LYKNDEHVVEWDNPNPDLPLYAQIWIGAPTASVAAVATYTDRMSNSPVVRRELRVNEKKGI